MIAKKPLLDWTGRLTRYEVEVVVDGQPKRYAWSGRGWNYVHQADGVHQIFSTDGAVIIPLPSASK